MSNKELGHKQRLPRETDEIYGGISTHDSLEAAQANEKYWRETWAKRRLVAKGFAELDTGPGSGLTLRQTGENKNHFTVWGTLEDRMKAWVMSHRMESR